MNKLDLSDLGREQFPNIPADYGSSLAKAGVVCLESQGHVQGVNLSVTGNGNRSYVLDWDPIHELDRRFWRDMSKATEYGAICIAVLLAKRETGHDVIEISWRGTGFDYWLGEAAGITLQRKARLEISGILQGNEYIIRRRVREKLAQTDRSDLLYKSKPAYVIVVEFSMPVAEVHNK